MHPAPHELDERAQLQSSQAQAQRGKGSLKLLSARKNASSNLSGLWAQQTAGNPFVGVRVLFSGGGARAVKISSLDFPAQLNMFYYQCIYI